MPPLGIPRILGVSISDLPGLMPGLVSEMEALVRLDANGDGLLLLSELQKGFVRNTTAGAVARLFLAQPKSAQSDWLAALDGAAVGKLLTTLPPEAFHAYLVQEISRWPDTSRGLIEAISTADSKGLLGQRLCDSFKRLQPPQQLQLLLATESRWHKLFLTSLCSNPTDMRDLAFLMIRLPHIDANGQFGAMLFSQLGEKCSDQLITYMDRNMYFANGQRFFREYLVSARHQAKIMTESRLIALYVPTPQLVSVKMHQLHLTPIDVAAETNAAVRVTIRGVTHNPGCTLYISSDRRDGMVVQGITAPALPPIPSTDTSEIAALKKQIASLPDPRPFFAQLGEQYYKTGNYGAALTAFERALNKIGEVDPAPEFIGRVRYLVGMTLQHLPPDQRPEEDLETESFIGAMQWWKNQIDIDALKKEVGANEQSYFQKHPDEQAMFQNTFCNLRDRTTSNSRHPVSSLFDILGSDWPSSPAIQQLLRTPCDL